LATKNNFKIWKVSEDSESGMMLTNDAAFLIGSRKNFVVANKNGVVIAGKSISLATSSENIRVGGLFAGMNDFAKMIPSTIVTPIPSILPIPPLSELLFNRISGNKENTIFYCVIS